MKTKAVYSSITILIITSIVVLSGCTPLYNNIVLDSQNHNVPCEELPSFEEVQETLAEYQDAVEEIEAVNPGQIFIDVDDTSCPGHADLVINYASRSDRMKIEQLINSDTFFGIPYRLRNR